MRPVLVAVVVAAMVLLAGCGRGLLIQGPAKEAARGQAALKTIREDATEAGRAVADARHATLLAADTVAGAARAAAAAIPQAEPWAGRLVDTAEALTSRVTPRLDEALKRVEAIQAAAPEAETIVGGMAKIAAERDLWQKEAAKEKERADSAVRKWLLLTAAGGFAGILAGGALFVWLSRKAGLTVGLASLAVFAVSIALYRWFEFFAWGGLALIVLAVAALGYGLWRNRHAFKTVVLGGENVKQALADGVQYTREELARLFNAVHSAAQKDAGGGVEEMVDAVKNGKG